MSTAGATAAPEGRELALLRYIVRSPLHLKVPPAKQGGYVIGKGPVGEAAQLVVARALVKRGLLESAPTDIGPGERFSITDDGRRAARGYAELTDDEARGMHIGDLKTVWADHEVARRHVSLRDQAAGTVRAALAALGHEYDATNGWNITAMVTPDGRLAFVNTASGTAVETDVRLDEDVVQAATIPDQADGPQASGAVAWVGVDIGESRNATAPAGWRQLLVDVRTDRGAEPQPTTMTWAAVTWWCLKTCYTSESARYGEPGLASLAGYPKVTVAVGDWPVSHEQRRRMNDVALSWLRAIATDVAAGCDPEIAALVTDDSAAEDIMRAFSRMPGEHPEVYSLESDLSMLTSRHSDGVITRAVGQAGIAAVVEVCRDLLRWQDVIAALLSRAVRAHLLPVATTAVAQLQTMQDLGAAQLGRTPHPERVSKQACDGLADVAEMFANRLLARARATGQDTLLALYAAYGGGEPVNVRIALRVHSPEEIVRNRVEGWLRSLAASTADRGTVSGAITYLSKEHVTAVVGTHPRDTAIVAGSDDGMTTRQIAPLAGLSHQRVSQITRATPKGRVAHQ